MARTTRKERMERRQVALQKVSNGMGISEVVDFVSAERGDRISLLCRLVNRPTNLDFLS